MTTLFLDFRQAFRSLLRAPGFLLTAVACLALGLGANLAVISHLDRMVLRPLPFPDSSRLAVLESMDPRAGGTGALTMADFLDLQAQCKSFQSVAACTSRVRTLTGAGEPVRLNVGMVTADFFGLLGVKPALGRLVFRAEEEVLPAPVAVLRHDLWMKRFGGDPAVLGHTVVLDGHALQVVGVLPANFRFYTRIQQSQVFTPEATPFAGRGNRGMGTFLGLGRLRPDVSVAAAHTEAKVIARRLGPATGNPEFDVAVTSLLEETVSNFKQILLLFQGALGLVLLITCFNVAGLQLVRNMARGQELAIRQALGAGQGLVRLFLAESLILALLGGAVGIGLSFYFQQGLGWLTKDLVPVPLEASLYPALFGAALGLSLLTGLGLALLSWFMARNPRLAETLKGGARGGHTRNHWRVLKGLVVAEVALSVMLLLGAGLLIRTLVNLRRVDPGFQTTGLLTVNIPLPPQKYTLPVQQTFLQQLELSLMALPGVEAVGVNDTLPFVKAHNVSFVYPEAGGGGRNESLTRNARWHVVSPGYFKTMGIPLVAGEVFPAADDRACVVSLRLAQSLWPNQDPLGRLVHSPGWSKPFTVSGVVGDTAENDLSRKEDPQLYVSAGAHGLDEGPVVALRVQGDPSRYAAPVKAAIRALDPDLALPTPQPMEAVLHQSTSLMMALVATTLFSAFGAIALALSAVVLYSVISQITQQRRREIGIRISLGATPARVVREVLSGAGGLVGLGLLLGSALGWALSRTLEQLLFGLKTPGPAIYLGVFALLIPAALLACLIPALRAAWIPPAEALRSE